MAHGKERGKYYARCPRCGKEVRGCANIKKHFGYRTCDNLPQSWCRNCRSYSSATSKKNNKEM